MRLKTLLIAVLFLFPFGRSIHAEYNLNNAQAVFIYNFLSHIKWPDNSIGSKYTIGVIGQTPTASYLEKYTANRKVGSRSIEVIRYSSVADIKNCQILFVPYSKSAVISDIEQKMSGKSCLIVGEKPGTTKSGAVINFDIVNGKLRYKIDKEKAKKQNLFVSASLLQMSM